MPHKVSPIDRCPPQAPAHRAAAPPVAEPSAIVDLASPPVPAVPPRTYGGFSRVGRPAVRGAVALISPGAPAARAGPPALPPPIPPRALPPPAADCASPAPVLQKNRLPAAAACTAVAPAAARRPVEGEFLEVVDTSSDEGRRGATDVPPADPGSALQRFLLDEAGRARRIVATDPAYAAVVAAFYVSTATLGSPRR